MYIVRVKIISYGDETTYFFGPTESFATARDYSEHVVAHPGKDQVVEAYVEDILPLYYVPLKERN